MKVTSILLLLLTLVVVVLLGGSQDHADDHVKACGHHDDYKALSASAAALFAQYLEDLRVYPYALDNVNEDLLEDLHVLFRPASRPASRRYGGYSPDRPADNEPKYLEELAAVNSRLQTGVYIAIGSLVLSFLGGLATWMILGYQQGWIPNGA